jgi:hypothetical protein
VSSALSGSEDEERLITQTASQASLRVARPNLGEGQLNFNGAFNRLEIPARDLAGLALKASLAGGGYVRSDINPLPPQLFFRVTFQLPVVAGRLGSAFP